MSTELLIPILGTISALIDSAIAALSTKRNNVINKMLDFEIQGIEISQW